MEQETEAGKEKPHHRPCNTLIASPESEVRSQSTKNQFTLRGQESCMLSLFQASSKSLVTTHSVILQNSPPLLSGISIEMGPTNVWSHTPQGWTSMLWSLWDRYFTPPLCPYVPDDSAHFGLWVARQLWIPLFVDCFECLSRERTLKKSLPLIWSKPSVGGW